MGAKTIKQGIETKQTSFCVKTNNLSSSIACNPDLALLVNTHAIWAAKTVESSLLEVYCSPLVRYFKQYTVMLIITQRNSHYINPNTKTLTGDCRKGILQSKA